MEELLGKFESVLDTNTDENKSNFDSLYKNWGRFGNQEERRKETLQVQKNNRNHKLDTTRGILDLVEAVERQDGQHNFFNSEKKTYYRPSIYVAGFNKVSTMYKNVLMLSEWMVEKPMDFNEEWLVVPCPKGVRMLVVAYQGRTKFYTKYGQFKFEQRTALPGGDPGRARGCQHCCVLDGFYSEKTNILYILDLLAWNSQPMTDGETEFRHFWMQTQLSEIPALKSINKKNKVLFSILPKVSCEKESFNKFMSTYPHFPDNFPTVDGLLFYHKRAHYVSGQTPLVGWLFPFMVSEVLGSDITVSMIYTLGKPLTYTNQVDYIKQFEEKMSKKLGKRRITSMETEETETDEAEAIEEDASKEGTKILDKEAMEESESTNKAQTVEKTTELIVTNSSQSKPDDKTAPDTKTEME